MLVVEDEVPLRQAVVKMLRKTGFEVFEAPDGSAAIDLLRAKADKIDLILLDMTIPGASSSQVAAEIAQVRSDISTRRSRQDASWCFDCIVTTFEPA